MLLTFPCLADGPAVTPVPAPSAPPWTEMRVASGEVVVLSAAPASEWDADPPPFTFEGGKYAVFLLRRGESRKVTITGPDKSRTRLLLVAGDGPAPKPPVPPDPKPADPLRVRLKAAYDADAEPVAARKEHAKDLAELYRQAAELAGKAEVATSGDLLARVRAASGTLVGPDALKGVRTEVARELGVVLPTDAALSDEQRKSVAELFKKLAAILDGF